eukprot:sb/3478210/
MMMMLIAPHPRLHPLHLESGSSLLRQIPETGSGPVEEVSLASIVACYTFPIQLPVMACQKVPKWAKSIHFIYIRCEQAGRLGGGIFSGDGWGHLCACQRSDE